MRITGLDVRRVAIPLDTEVKWEGVSESANDMLMLRIATDEGVFGLAQKKIHPAWNGMSLAMVALDLREVHAPLLIGQDPLRPERIWQQIDRVAGWSPAKVLLDIALHDLAARAAGLPMWKYLGGWSDTVDVLGFIARGDSSERIAQMQQQIETYGFKGFKVKIGMNAAADCAFLRVLRRELGDDLVIRVDANSRYTLDEALQVARCLADLGIQDFEDPCSLAGRNVRRELLARSPVPVVVDNIIDSSRTARMVLEEGAMRLALKVSRLGYRRTMEIMAACREFGAQVVAGSMTECAIGALGALHFHGAFRDFAWSAAEDSYFATLPDDVIDRPAITAGRVCLGEEPGLGPDWDDEKVERYGLPLGC